MGEQNCYYHSNRKSVKKCETCGKLLCAECNQIYTSKNKSRSTQDLCPTCLYEKYNDPILIVIFMGCSIILLGIISSLSGLIGFLIGGFVLCTTIIALFMIQKEKNAAAKEKAHKAWQKAYKAMSKTKAKNKKAKPKDPNQIVQTALYCRFCGAPIEFGENTCQYCGMIWEWQ